MSNLIQFPKKEPEKQSDPQLEKINKLQAYVGLKLFELAEMRRNFVKMSKQLKALEGKKRLRLVSDAASPSKKTD